MILTFEYNRNGVVEIFMDGEGREVLMKTLRSLSTANADISHDHLMTPSWGGAELTEELQNPANELINKVTVFLVTDDG
jgi:hypothetical protein